MAYLGESEIKRSEKDIPLEGQLHGAGGQRGAKRMPTGEKSMQEVILPRYQMQSGVKRPAAWGRGEGDLRDWLYTLG